MSGDVTYQALDRLSYLPDRALEDNGLCIAGQKYYDVYFTGGDIDGVTIGGTTPAPGHFSTLSVTQTASAGGFVAGYTQRVTIGVASLNQVIGSSGSAVASIDNYGSSQPVYKFTNSNGAAPNDHSALSSGQIIGQVDYYGDDGTNFTRGGSLRAIVDASPSAGIMPTRYDVFTMDSTGALNRNLRVDSKRNVILNSAALATNATNGFLWIPSSPGAPSGIPTPPYTGAIALTYDSTNNKLYAYNGGWKSVTLT